jgi:hypothetical protein
MENITRGVLTFFLCVVLVGFGLCGAYGTFGGLADLVGGLLNDSAVVFFGLVGLGIAWACWRGIVDLWRKRRPPPDA